MMLQTHILNIPTGIKKLSAKDDKLSIPAVGRWLLFADLIALSLAFFVGGLTSWLVRNGFSPRPLGTFLMEISAQQIALFFGLGVFALLWLDTKAHYRQRLPFWEMAGNIVFVGIAGLVLAGFIQFIGKNLYSRLWLSFSWTFFIFFLFFSRPLARLILDRCGLWQIPCLMIGEGKTARAAQKALATEPHMGLSLCNTLPAEQIKGLGTEETWACFLKRNRSTFVFLALSGKEMEEYHREIKALIREQIAYSIIPPWRGLPLSTLSTHHFILHDVLMMHDSNRLRLLLPSLIKRSFDVLLASLALVAASPFMLFAALALRLDGGTAFFSHPRVGRKGKLFHCLKFRTMKMNAEELLQKYLDENPAYAEEWQKYQKLKEDPRVTFLGQWMRKTSFDELPQLINVIRGEMSLVGPRPFMPGQEAFYGDELLAYTSVRPGITGPWQVAGRNQLSFSDRVSLEAWYTRNWTFWLDIVIILKTFPALLTRGTAF